MDELGPSAQHHEHECAVCTDGGHVVQARLVSLLRAHSEDGGDVWDLVWLPVMGPIDQGRPGATDFDKGKHDAVQLIETETTSYIW